ncbi:hypothetical protein [Hansschlegelia sp. KR7-227]|uniref:hypothetical protein n=1 Tax=Hansschlegelia sp. KR7-227 TaxID=3400914 RepID=UPI003C0CEC83
MLAILYEIVDDLGRPGAGARAERRLLDQPGRTAKPSNTFVRYLKTTEPCSQYSLIKRKSAWLAFTCIFFLGACDDPAPPAPPAGATAPRVNAFSIADRRWIDVNDKIAPAVWLASREADRDVAPDDPSVAALRGLLGEADLRFTEDPRMIANRAVQVQAMLAERGVKESPRQVIEGLVSIAAPDERAGFGETCQHYVNARTAGRTRAEALEALRRQGAPLPTPRESQP